jgi:hypothetical protein
MIRWFLKLFFLFLWIATVVQAQSECPTIVEEALSEIGENCGNLERNSACYGANQLERLTVLNPSPADFFVVPGDRGILNQFREIRPLPLDEDENTYGVAILNVQADVPNTLPGQAVIFMIMGDARLTNAGPPIGSAASPFQSFYFVPGIGTSDCYEGDPTLTIQTPDNVTLNLTLNGIDMEMAPNTLLTITHNVCTIHRGSNGILDANQSLDLTIDPEGTLTPLGIRTLSEREYERGIFLQEKMNLLAATNNWDEQVVIPPPDEFGVEPAAAPATAACEVQHTVQAGESLHAIAKRYATSVLGIAEANQLANPRLLSVGQVLCIPNPNSGFEALPAGQ